MDYRELIMLCALFVPSCGEGLCEEAAPDFSTLAERVLVAAREHDSRLFTIWTHYEGMEVLVAQVRRDPHLVLPLLGKPEFYSRHLACDLLHQAGKPIDDAVAGYLLAVMVEDSDMILGFFILGNIEVLGCDPWFRECILTAACRSKYEGVAIRAAKMRMRALQCAERQGSAPPYKDPVIEDQRPAPPSDQPSPPPPVRDGG